jgi:CBS domain-containing protein
METDEPVLRVRDLMQRDVISVTPETPILDVYRLFIEEEIHGAPVVDEDAIVRGVITTLDLLRVTRDELEPGAAATATEYFRDDLPYPVSGWMHLPGDVQDRMASVCAKDAMSREIVKVGPDTTVEEVAHIMLEQRIHRVLVVDAGALVGLITTFDALRAIGRQTRPKAYPMRETGYSR